MAGGHSDASRAAIVLSRSCKSPRVQGSIHTATTCVEVLAELKILKFQSVADLETQMNVFEGDGTLMLVTDLPPFAQSLLGPIA